MEFQEYVEEIMSRDKLNSIGVYDAMKESNDTRKTEQVSTP